MATKSKRQLEIEVLFEQGYTPQKRAFWVEKYWKTILGIVITSVFLLFLIRSADPARLWATLRGAKYSLIITSSGLTIILFLLKTIRWNVILKRQNVALSFTTTLKLILIGTFGSAITPAKVGDVLRAFYLREEKKEVKIGSAVFSVVFDRLFDLAGIFVIILLSLPFCLLAIPTIDWRIPVGISSSFVLFTSLVILTFSEKVLRPLLNFLLKIISKVFLKETAKEKFSISSAEILADFFKYQKNFKVKNYFFLGGLSVLFWVILGFQGTLLLYAFHINNVNPFFILATLAIAAVVAMTVPLSVSGVGIREYVIQTFLVFLIPGLVKAQAINLSLLQTLENVFLPAFLGGIIIIFLSRKKVMLK
ncbi:MAG: lysylphosphatidylglycerol synthase transmembrane domain-containing protein [Candidatus Heimdallarchaeota archaeon]